jgi:hypothetical protein
MERDVGDSWGRQDEVLGNVSEGGDTMTDSVEKEVDGSIRLLQVCWAGRCSNMTDN